MNTLNSLIFLLYKLHHRSSTWLYIGLWKYWDFQSEAKAEQIMAIVTTHSVSCLELYNPFWVFYLLIHFVYFLKEAISCLNSIYQFQFLAYVFFNYICRKPATNHLVLENIPINSLTSLILVMSAFLCKKISTFFK